MRRDGVAWLICIAATLAGRLLQGDALRLDNLNSISSIAYTLGTFIGIFFWCFPSAGRLKNPLACNGRDKRRRFGFTLGAFGIVALSAIGEYQTQRVQSEEVANSVRHFSKNSVRHWQILLRRCG